jgi:hypothetical protein
MAFKAVASNLKARPLSINAELVESDNLTVSDHGEARWAGAYGKVFIRIASFLADIDSKVAVKEAISGSLLNEAIVLQHLQGGHITIPFLFGMLNTRKALVLELVSSKDCSVRHHLQQSSFSSNQWMVISAGIADGLAFIHRRMSWL